MTRKESDLLTYMIQERSMDFWSENTGEFDPKAWRAYFKKINARMIEEDELCEAYNNSNGDKVLVKNPRIGMAWIILPKDLALKCLVLGQMPPRYSKKQPIKR